MQIEYLTRNMDLNTTLMPMLVWHWLTILCPYVIKWAYCTSHHLNTLKQESCSIQYVLHTCWVLFMFWQFVFVWTLAGFVVVCVALEPMQGGYTVTDIHLLKNGNYTAGLWRLQRYHMAWTMFGQLGLFVFSPTSLWCRWRLLRVKTTLSKVNKVISSFSVIHIKNHFHCKPFAHHDHCDLSQWKKRCNSSLLFNTD